MKSRFRRIIGLGSHCIRLMESWKPDCVRASRETCDKVLLRRSAGHFLWSGLRARVAELRRFRVCFRATQPSFSSVQTVWRSVQSGANCSPFQIPANRGEYREFCHSCWQGRSVCTLKVDIRQQLLAIATRYEQRFIRTVTGNFMTLAGQPVCLELS